MSKQTAVGFLREKLEKYIMWNEGHHKAEEHTLSNLLNDFEQAEVMEKEQMIEFGESVCQDGFEEWVEEEFNKKYK
jgi:hypothetical protein